jgi:uncharacterized protein (DUF885 family)
MRIIGIIAVCLLFVACGQPEEKEVEVIDQNQDFQSYTTTFVDHLWKTYPSWASSEGMHDYDSVLTIFNAEKRKEVRAFIDSNQRMLNRFDLNGLSELNQIDYYLIRDFLLKEKFYLDDMKGGQWNPAQYNLGGQFFNVLSYQGKSLEDRLSAINHKLDRVAEYYSYAKKNLKQPTLVHTDLAISQVSGSVSIFNESIRDSIALSKWSKEQKEAMESKLDDAISAINGYVSWLTDDLKPQVERGERVRDFRLGDTLYDQKFKYNMGSSFSAREIYQKAIERKLLLHEKMYDVTARLWPKYFGESSLPEYREEAIMKMIDTLSYVHAHRDSFITTIRAQIPELVNFINEKDLLTLDPEKPLTVRATPEYMRGVAGASISAPGPYDADAETYYNVTPLDHYSEAEAESYLREYNQYLLQILNIHEAIPGHYTQLVYSNKSPSLIKSILGNGAMIEGWAVYTELMMLENGYGNNSDELWLMYYKWNLRTVCNTILDYSVHVLGMNEEEAITLLTKEAFQQEEEAKGKWKRVQLTSVQLCSYFTGFYEIMDLREELKRKKGDQFDLKTFHEEFLSYGSAPVKYIRMLMVD